MLLDYVTWLKTSKSLISNRAMQDNVSSIAKVSLKTQLWETFGGKPFTMWKVYNPNGNHLTSDNHFRILNKTIRAKSVLLNDLVLNTLYDFPKL
jgi:hypothetical protein